MSNDLLTQLEKLSELKDKGIITDNEFNEKKRLLLNELDNSIKIEKKKKMSKIKQPIGYQFLLLF